MLKKAIIIGICCLLLFVPVTSGFVTPAQQQYLPQKLIRPIPLQTLEDPPEWANGNFTGVWGLNILGIPTPPIGWIVGYYENMGLGRFVGVFAEFNVTNATGGLIGMMLWVFFIGGVGSIATGNGTYVAGIGVANETHYYVRLNAIIGPSYYVHVNYTKFE